MFHVSMFSICVVPTSVFASGYVMNFVYTSKHFLVFVSGHNKETSWQSC